MIQASMNSDDDDDGISSQDITIGSKKKGTYMSMKSSKNNIVDDLSVGTVDEDVVKLKNISSYNKSELIEIAQKIGVKKIKDFVSRIELNAELNPDLSLSLGSFGVTLMDIVRSYGLFPNHGKLVKLKHIISITDRFGKSYEIEETKKLDTEELDKLLMSRKMTGASGSVKSPTLQSSPGLTQHLLSQIGAGGKASKAIGF